MKAQPAILEPRATATLDDYVTDLAWSGDGTRLAIAGGEGRVFLARHDAGSLAVRELGEHLMGALAVAWRPKAEAFVTSGQDNAIAFWDGVSGAEQRRIRPAMAWTEHLAWSPDGSQLASAAGKRWDASGYGCYGAVKEAIRQLTRAAACEWGQDNIRSNVLLPLAESAGLKGWAAARPDEAAAYFATIPLRRVGECEADIGRFVVALCSEDCRYVNGQSIGLDGGQAYLG